MRGRGSSWFFAIGILVATGGFSGCGRATEDVGAGGGGGADEDTSPPAVCEIARSFPIPLDNTIANALVTRRNKGFAVGQLALLGNGVTHGVLWKVLDAAGKPALSGQATGVELSGATVMTGLPGVLQVINPTALTDLANAFEVRVFANGSEAWQLGSPLPKVASDVSVTPHAVTSLDGSRVLISLWPAQGLPWAMLVDAGGRQVGAPFTFSPGRDEGLRAICQSEIATEHGALLSYVDADERQLHVIDVDSDGRWSLSSAPWLEALCPYSLIRTSLGVFAFRQSEDLGDGSAWQSVLLQSDGGATTRSWNFDSPVGAPLAGASIHGSLLFLTLSVDNRRELVEVRGDDVRRFPITGPGAYLRFDSEPSSLFAIHPAGETVDIVVFGCR